MNHKVKLYLAFLFVATICAITSGCGEKEPEGSPVQPAPAGSAERGAGAGPNRASTAAPE